MKTHPLYLNGEFVETGDLIDVINPATGEAFAKQATVDRAGVKQALEDAQAAFDGWRKLTGMARADYIYKIIDALKARLDECAETIVDNGKKLAGYVLEAAVEDIEFDDGTFTVAGTDKTMNLMDAAKHAHNFMTAPPGFELGLDEWAAWSPPAPWPR